MMTDAWLLEFKNDAGQTNYWTGSGWVNDASSAMRFCRQRDAEHARDERSRQDKLDVELWQKAMAPMMADGVRVVRRTFDIFDRITR